MSKIAENRVHELGYFKDPLDRQEFTANDVFDCGVECYDQAMQDLLEKACEWLQKEVVDDYTGIIWDDCIQDFKKYMEEEQ